MLGAVWERFIYPSMLGAVWERFIYPSMLGAVWERFIYPSVCDVRLSDRPFPAVPKSPDGSSNSVKKSL